MRRAFAKEAAPPPPSTERLPARSKTPAAGTAAHVLTPQDAEDAASLLAPHHDPDAEIELSEAQLLTLREEHREAVARYQELEEGPRAALDALGDAFERLHIVPSAESIALDAEAAEVAASPEYRAYEAEVERAVAAIHDKWFGGDKPVTALSLQQCQSEVGTTIERLRESHIAALRRNGRAPSWAPRDADERRSTLRRLRKALLD